MTVIMINNSVLIIVTVILTIVLIIIVILSSTIVRITPMIVTNHLRLMIRTIIKIIAIPKTPPRPDN